MIHEPFSAEQEAWFAACEQYNESDQFVVDAWDWLTSQPGPPDWLYHELDGRYRQTADYVTAVEDLMDGER